MERSFKPTTTLVDTFFPEVRTFVTETVEMEYRKGTRKMAPFVTPGAKGVNMARSGSQLRVYKAPLMKPKRVIEASDIMRRGFGELFTASVLLQNVPRRCVLTIWRNLLTALPAAKNGWRRRCCLMAAAR